MTSAIRVSMTGHRHRSAREHLTLVKPAARTPRKSAGWLRSNERDAARKSLHVGMCWSAGCSGDGFARRVTRNPMKRACACFRRAHRHPSARTRFAPSRRGLRTLLHDRSALGRNSLKRQTDTPSAPTARRGAAGTGREGHATSARPFFRQRSCAAAGAVAGGDRRNPSGARTRYAPVWWMPSQALWRPGSLPTDQDGSKA